MLGRLKEYDWWVKPAEVQLGIFPVLSDPEYQRGLRELAAKIDDYPDDVPAHETKPQDGKLPE